MNEPAPIDFYKETYMKFSKAMLTLTLAASSLFAVGNASAQKDPDVGGAPMYSNKTIVENASAAPNLSTLVTAVKAAGLVDTLSGAGPFTVFAPTNDAFAKLPAGTLDTLTQPDNQAQLKKILTYHVVAGRVSSKELVKMIKKGGGTATLPTVAGGPIKATLTGSNVTLTDEKGGTATVTTADVFQSNGVVHVIDSVLMPN